MQKTLSVAIALLLSCGAALAQEQETRMGTRVTEWLQGLKHKISLLRPRKVIPVSTGVAGVRGTKEDEQVALYWKGKKSEEAVSEEELTEFRKVLETVETGDSANAIKELEKFMKKFPDSALIPDAKKTLDIVSAEPPVQEKKPETRAEQKQHEGVQSGEEEKEAK